jgi:hypothetical protein
VFSGSKILQHNKNELLPAISHTSYVILLISKENVDVCGLFAVRSKIPKAKLVARSETVWTNWSYCTNSNLCRCSLLITTTALATTDETETHGHDEPYEQDEHSSSQQNPLPDTSFPADNEVAKVVSKKQIIAIDGC